MSDDYTPPTPGEHHKKLQPFVGTFRAEITIWFAPDQKMESTGTMVNRWVLGDLYIEHDYVGDANESPYPSFEGKGFWGYNTFSNQYEGAWVDNAASAFQSETGSVDESGKVWTMTSEVPSPHGGTMKKKSIITVIDNDHHSMETYIVGADGEFKNMELQYKRTT